jgi:co-chaperonin GroES (HSP10)
MREVSTILGARVKIQIVVPEEQKSKGGIITSSDVKDLEDIDVGIVLQLGKEAYGNFDTNWCDVGDKVQFQRYAGKPIEELGSDGKMKYIRFLKDIDVIAKFETVESDAETHDDKVLKTVKSINNKLTEVENE